MRYVKGLIPTALLVIAATAVGIACTGSSSENDSAAQAALKPGGNNPPGNNGTVKIQEAGDNEEIPDNDPHVGCKFDIEFRGFDEGNLHATWELSAHPPSGTTSVTGVQTVFIGEDPAGGANDLDAVVHVDLSQYDLSGLTEHPKQGFHLKLDVHAEGSKGADTKHKVFWVKGCTPPPPPQDAGPDAPPPQDAGPDAPPPQDAGPKCGDGHVDMGEECDLGEENGEPGSSCSATCHRVSKCGDGHVDMGEECDLGEENGEPGKNCTVDCKFPPKPDGGQTW